MEAINFAVLLGILGTIISLDQETDSPLATGREVLQNAWSTMEISAAVT
jgi:hypothetical protein